ncbi:MAG: hypothetical protein FJW26_07805 [Acidimicrobiia bacterium]|nr:hypothetical protein [Acidimicrobiia bacterium]
MRKITAPIALRLGLACLLVFAWLGTPPRPVVLNPPDSAQETDLVDHFRATAVGLLRHTGTNREKIILPYWTVRNSLAFSSDKDRESWFADRLWTLESPELLKIHWNGRDFEAQNDLPRLCSQGNERARLWLLLRNRHTQDLQVQAAWVGGSDKQAQHFLIPEAGARAFLLQPKIVASGSKLELHLSSSSSQKGFSFATSSKKPGRLAARILDESGQPTAARVYLTNSEGLFEPLEGATKGQKIERVGWVAGEYFSYADGAFRATLPEGTSMIEVVKGAEHIPVRQKVQIQGGKEIQVSMQLKRLESPKLRGWHAGDEHVHANYRSKEFYIQPEDVALIAQGEDLQVINLMVSNSDGGFVHDENRFEGAPHPLSTPRHILYWNQEMRNRALYGHLILLNLKQLVHPIYTGFPGAKHEEDYPPNFIHAQNTHRQGGLVSYAHTGGNGGYRYGGADAHEAPVDVALGTVDAFEVFCSHSESSLDLYYRLLNCGFPLAITAGSDAFLNQTFGTTPGGERVYVYTGEEFNYARWIEGLRAGHTFVTEGPLLAFELDGHMPGERLHLKSAPARLRVKARSWSWLPLQRLEIIANGKVVAQVEQTKGVNDLNLSQEVTLPQSAWVAARVWGPRHRLVMNEPSPALAGSLKSTLGTEVALAHSSPIYVELAGKKIWSRADARYFENWIERLIDDVRTRGTFHEESRRQEVIELFRKAQRVYQATP